MERTSIRCILPSLVTLVILVFFPAGSWCKVDTYSAPTQVKSEGCACSDTVRKLKRFDDIDYDSFVGLMGKRSAPQPNKIMAHILAALLGERTRMSCPCGRENSQTRKGCLNDESQRFHRFQ